jgi:hypothetical protein
MQAQFKKPADLKFIGANCMAAHSACD